VSTAEDPLGTDELDGAQQLEAEQHRVDRDREIADLKWLMGHEEGRRIAWGLLGRAGVFRTSFSPDGLQMAFNEGNRNLGVYLLAEINEHCPRRYMEMIKEQKENGHRSKRAAN